MTFHSRVTHRACNAGRGGLLALIVCSMLALPAAATAATSANSRTTASSSTTTTATSTTSPSTTTTTTTTPTTTASTTTTPSTTTSTTTTPSTTTSTTTTTTPTPPPARAAGALGLSDLFYVHGSPVTIPGRTVAMFARVRPYVAGQEVSIDAYLGGRLFDHVHRRLARSKGGTYGGFQWSVASPGAGTVRIVVQHIATGTLSSFKLDQSFAALDTNVDFGSSGRFVELIQQRLSALHFYIPLTGVYDQGTGLAVDAYHRLLGDGTSQLLDPATLDDLLNNVGSFRVRYPNQGRHAEGDLSDQLLALTNGASVYWILPISSGKPSTPTILGNFQVYSRVPGYLPDGMYYSDFFIRGYAIHGYDPAPDYPASHGCMRLPIVDAIPVYNWLNFGDWVDSYYT